jgi:glycosyltransferase involved in cell wall biosynthesis
MKIAVITTDNREEFRKYSDPVPQFGTAPTALLEGFRKLPNCEIHVISCVQKPLPSPSMIGKNIYYHSILVGKWGWLRGVYVGCTLAVRRKLQEIQPDIVHGQGTERNCALNAVFSGFPNILTVHGNMRVIAEINAAKAFSFQWFAARLETFTLPKTKGVICITNYTRDLVKPFVRKTWLLPNAVDDWFFQIDRAPSKKKQILCTGFISTRKNQNKLIRSLDALSKELDFELLFIGATIKDDPYSQEFQKLISTRPWCRHLGFVDRSQLGPFLREATLLALPSLEDNCPMVVLEAMAAGVPVVAAAVGGVPDLIKPGITGLLCDPQDETDMCNKIKTFLVDSGIADKIAKRAKVEAVNRFRTEVVAQRHLDIYREVLTDS